MPSLADVVQQMGPSITYDERTKRFHDMEQNYRMVSTRGVVAGGPARTDGRGSSGYVTQEAFNSFRSEIYLYISKVASFTREALVEMQRSMTGEQRDTETLRDAERQESEERKERRKELLSGALTRVSSGIRQTTGMGPLGALFTGLFGALTAVLANTDIEKIRETFNSIGAVFDNIKEFFNKLQEYSNIILAIGAALAAMVAANMLNRSRPTQPRPSSPRPPSQPAPRNPAGGPSAPPGRPAAPPMAPPPPAPPATPPPPAAPPRPPAPPAPPAAPGTPTSLPPSTSGQPDRDRPSGNRLGRAARFLAIPGISAILESINANQQINQLSEQRDNNEIDDEKYKNEVIAVVARALGAIGGGAVGGSIGAAFGSILPGPGNLIGGILGAYLGANAGATAGEWFVNTGMGRYVADAIYDRFFAESPTGQPEAQLVSQLTELQRQRRERTASIDEMTQITDRAVSEGRITTNQARQIEEVGAQEGTNLRIGDIELAIEQMQASGLEGAGSVLRPARDAGTGRVIVLPPIYQEVIGGMPTQTQAAPAPAAPAEIQTRTPDPTLGQASQAATFSGGQQRGGLIDRARARNAR